ncbi:ABC transporter ATP-binding protein [Cellvibrio sp. UBA7671]|uniref:ATP-binding cassette domain-containing protein n=1 Tax=Cellvibrio sp. UBA7671 TaxID=1946312 RepID=UPI002F35D15A
MIKKITITNIKGIGENTVNGIYEFDVPKNKPSIFVAPNGFGKSSLATAFKSLKSSKIELHKDDFHQGKDDIVPRIEVTYLDDNGDISVLRANDTTNEINNVFDYFVINNQVFAKAKKSRIGGHVIASASLETPPIVLSSSIPEKSEFNYSIANHRNKIGRNGKVLPNISSIYKNGKFIAELNNHLVYLERVSGQRIQEKINSFIQRLNEQNGSRSKLLDWIDENELEFLEGTNNLSNIAALCVSFDLGFTNSAENHLAAIQLALDFNENPLDFKKAVRRSIYDLGKSSYDRLFNDFNSSWKEFKPKEKDGKLVVEMPKVHQISNGQRDVMCFIALLKKAELNLTKKRSILIIDEVFDYLDDANLIAVQYYVTQLIAKFKDEGKMFYPIILTHLDPSYFRNYTFSDQKVFYLEKREAKINSHLKKLLVNREKPEIESAVSKYYLHYEPQPINVRQEFETLDLKPTWGDSSVFDQYVFSEFEKYMANESVYDPFAVCCALRKKIEKYAYERLDSEYLKAEFLDKHKTPNKLKFSESKGIVIPESFYLLGIIYNDGMHWKNNEAAISGKLENMIIKKMIKDVK